MHSLQHSYLQTTLQMETTLTQLGTNLFTQNLFVTPHGAESDMVLLHNIDAYPISNKQIYYSLGTESFVGQY